MAPLFEFDPTSEDSANSPLEIWHTTDYTVTAFSCPAPAYSVQWAASVDTEGGVPASRTPQNRTVSLTVDVASVTGLRNLQSKVAKIAREGGTAKLTYPNGEVKILDLLATETFEPQLDITYYVNSGAYCTVQMAFTTMPFGRGPEVTLTLHTESTNPALIFTETGIKGDVPGLGRLVISELQTQNQNTLVWGVQSRYYDAAAPLFFQAEGNGVNGVDAVGPAGASGGGTNKTIFNGTLGAVASEDFAILSSHAGTFRVIARVQVPATNAGTVSVVLKYRAGFDRYTVNDTVTIDPTYEGVWVLVDLGYASFKRRTTSDAAELGFFTTSTTTGDDIYWDWVMLIPVDEGTGIATSSTGDVMLPLSAGSQMQISHKDVLLSHSISSLAPAKPSKYEGDYLFIPPAGLEARTVRIIVKASRGKLINGLTADTANADAGTDDISGQLYYTPRYLAIPSP